MKLLLDTHALLWWLSDDAKLGAKARALIEDPANEIVVSVVSLWEIVVKKRIGKLDANIEQIADALQADGFFQLSVRTDHLKLLEDLPTHHSVPFDHLLIAQAIAEGATFVSEDHQTPAYPVNVITCSDG